MPIKSGINRNQFYIYELEFVLQKMVTVLEDRLTESSETDEMDKF